MLSPEEAEADPSADSEVEDEEAPVSENLRTARNSIYFEFLGPGLFYSLNYDRMITDDFSARIGFFYLGWSASAGDADASVS